MTIPHAAGTCLCGTVRIELTDAEPHVEVWHRAMCRQSGGGPFMCIGGASFALSGEARAAIYPSSDRAERAFCNTCGSNLNYRFLPTDNYNPCASLFELGDAFAIQKQIFVDEKPALYDFAPETPIQISAEVVADAVAAGFTFPEQTDRS